ncbi:16S rRNA (cytosine(1402)-N(4))-methyltransferase RsmH [Neisseria weaveri]|uniref:16S rRNA (cytosine(1402)-N(4))-methyltransferase RsmH n=1 Tax=Neisseria weaveri TaxID=28091 RepID=UPI00030223F0|nr:16S rRNA (cytosine(1402)-N(4))-methyltransferase RsmH [Neisseria weaveri]
MSEVEEFKHITVLLHETVDSLAVKNDGIYVDGTFGRGGHSRLLLSKLGKNGRLVVFDKDPQAIAVAESLAAEDERVSVVHDGFVNFQTALGELGIDKIDGAMFDLGISSPQIDDGRRGFSFRFDAPLDMRMDTTRGVSAAEWLASATEQEIHEVIKNYGEERFSRQIARAIVVQREEAPIDTTRKLAELVAKNVRTRECGQDPATRTFQAIRIFINRELEEVEGVLPQVVGRLKSGGRLAVIAFHSLEDRIVKQFMKKHSQHEALPKWVAVKEEDLPVPPLMLIGKAIKAGEDEVRANPRSRSAILRVAERTDGCFETERPSEK